MSTLKPIIEVFILFLMIYGIFQFLRGSRGLGILRGLGTMALILIISVFNFEDFKLILA